MKSPNIKKYKKKYNQIKLKKIIKQMQKIKLSDESQMMDIDSDDNNKMDVD